MEIKIDQNRMLWWLIPRLVVVEISIFIFDALITELKWVSLESAQDFFDMTREDGVANFFSSFQMLAVGAVLLLITLAVRGRSQGSSSRLVWGWGLVTALFFYMGVDDATRLHERVGTVFGELVTDSGGLPDSGFLGQLYDSFPSYTWQLALGPFVAIAGLFVFVFLMRQLPAPDLKLLVLVALGLFATAVGMDFAEGMDNDLMLRVADAFSTTPDRAIHFSRSIEEFLEMAGTTVFLFVFLKTLVYSTPSMNFELNRQR